MNQDGCRGIGARTWASGFLILLSGTLFIAGMTEAGCRIYRIGIQTEDLQGLNGTLGLELTNAGHIVGVEDDKVTMTAYSHNGVFDDANTFGGWAQAGGTIADPGCSCGSPSESWIYSDRGFYNGMRVDYSSLGTYINFHVEMTDAPSDGSSFPSQFSVFFYGGNYYPMLTTADPYGANAILTISSGPSCEEIVAYAPAVFVGLDSVYIDLGGVTSVPAKERDTDLHVVMMSPNPTMGRVALQYSGGAGSVKFAVFNIQGQRLLHEEASERMSEEGIFQWRGEDSAGKQVAEGVYFIQIRNGTKSIVQKVVVAR